MKIIALFISFIIFVSCNVLPENTTPLVHQTETTVSDVLRFFQTNATDSSKLNDYWLELKSNKNIPFTHGDTALFLYKGSATTVQWQGDFSGWGNNSTVNSNGSRIGNTDIFYLKLSFPSDARLDYKVVVNSNWILDPNNSYQQWSGFGPNSELRMPEYFPSPYKTLQTDVLGGTLRNAVSLSSTHLGYSVNYRVWTPHNYDAEREEAYKVLFTTDGHEYADQRLGALTQVAANLIHSNNIEPIVIVFVSPLNPTNTSQNRRMTEYALNVSFSNFLVNELVPKIETDFNVSTNADGRAMLGTSLGGLHSAYILATQSSTFNRIAIHSPAFWYRTQIFDLMRAHNGTPNRLFMSTGTIRDTENDADQMKAIFDSKSWKYEYIKVNEGHSWGNWSGLMDETLIHLFGQLSTSIER